MATWQQQAWKIHQVVIKRWEVASEEDKRFLMLALCGETGEAANVMKKLWRSSGTAKDNVSVKDLIEELVDIRIYLELLARCFGANLDFECEQKIPELLRRWPEALPEIAKLNDLN